MKHSKLTRRRFVQGSLALLAAGGLNLKASGAGKSDTLVVYLSRTGNNKALAQFVAQSTGADLAAIETAEPYPQNYAQMRDQAAQEIADGVLPPLKNMPNTEPYRRIVIVFPTWAMRLPAPVKSFLIGRNLRGKTILPLNTNAGYGVGSGFEEIKQLAAGADVRPGLSLKGGNERDGILLVMKGNALTQAQNQIRPWLAKN